MVGFKKPSLSFVVYTSPTSFQFLLHNILKYVFHLIVSYLRFNLGNLNRCFTSSYKTKMSAGFQSLFIKSLLPIIEDALHTHFIIFLIFDNFCFPPFIFVTSQVLNILYGGIFLPLSPQNHINIKFGRGMVGNTYVSVL